MKLQNPDKKTLRGAFNQESSLVVASGSGDFGMDGLKSDGNFPVKEALMEEEDEGGDKVRKIQVSGGNISLVVDFSGSLTGNSSHNVFESRGSCVNESLVKRNGYREDETQEFLVGNLVWVMNKYKKWWPGEVVDFKADAKESFMVRFIGQGHLVSWFASSKLKPFKESFEQVLNQRNDVGFFAALEKAMSLLSNSLKLDMTCSCIADGNGMVTAKNVPTWKSKPLILREFSVDRLEPKEFVTQLKDIAKCVLNAGVLESTVMQCRLSAFYTLFGHKQIPMSQLHENEGRKSFTTKMNDSQFIGSPSVVAGNSRNRFRKEWFRKFVSEVDNVSARDHLVNVPPSDLISKLKLLAVDHRCSQETENIGLFEWFFSKFRISVFHDENAYKMQLANMAGFKDSMLARKANSGTHQKTSKSKKLGKSKIELFSGVTVADTEKKTFESQISEKSKIESLNCVSIPDNVHEASKSKNSGKTKINQIIGHSDFSSSVANKPFSKDFQETPLVRFPDGRPTMMGDTLSRTAATLVPDLNSGGNSLGIVEYEHFQRAEMLMPPNVCPQEQNTPRSTILNFQVTSPCSTNGVSGTQFVSSQPPSFRHFTSEDLFTKKKRGRKRKNAQQELPIVAHSTTGIPDLNGMVTEPASVLPQVQPTQRRRRRKKEELSNGITRGITILFLKFSSRVSMPSRDDLTSRFSAFGPLDSSETHVSEEFSGAQVAFVSSSDAIEAVKSLEKANPFGETLVSFRLQQKLITVQRNIAPRMPVISHVSPIPIPNNIPTSVESMRQNLLMMTAMLEKSGDSLSRETKAKLKSEITGLLEKVSSMPSSSSS
ncbi:PREDICTED: serine/threonine-protein kinase ATM-like [Camelina sativa]|uniref:Serine/threonine-protein kinase ATM-like n=1 Tax=Camelina sativa TaxID=90675 RepID=A0ABM1QDG5_CAMSA|nr:PREDICTED: serine/threonine-protein kinase ATM-like [Camelina sativa]